MKHIFRRFMGFLALCAALGALFAWMKENEKEHRYIVVSENREEIL